MKNKWINNRLVTTNTQITNYDDALTIGQIFTPITLTLPPNPQDGDGFFIKDGCGSAGNAQITIAGNGHTIDGQPNDYLFQAYQAVLIFFDADLGWVKEAAINDVESQLTSVIMAGDVTGTAADNTVIKIQGTAVSTTNPTNGQVFQYNSTNAQWQPTSVTAIQINGINTNYQVPSDGNSYDITVTTISAPITVTLPVTPVIGQEVCVYDRAGSASDYNITIAPASGQLIDGYGVAQLTLNFTSKSLKYVGGGSNRWIVKGSNNGATILNTSPVVPITADGYVDQIYGVFAWSGELTNDSNAQQLLNWCGTQGYNRLYYCFDANVTYTADRSTYHQIAKWISAFKQSGISVHNIMSDRWGSVLPYVPNYGASFGRAWNQRLHKHLEYQNFADSQTAFPNARFDGVSVDFEPWPANAYSLAEAVGNAEFCKLIKHRDPRAIVSFQPGWGALTAPDGYQLPVGGTNQTLMIPFGTKTFTNQDFIYNGVGGEWYDGYAIEGAWLMQHCDEIIIQAYNITSAELIAKIQPWLDYATMFGTGKQIGIILLNLVTVAPLSPYEKSFQPLGRSAMITVLTQVSQYFYEKYLQPDGSSFNLSWMGHCISTYEQDTSLGA